MQEEVRRIQDAVKKLNGVVAQRSKLLTQQHENEMVDKELADVKEEGRGGGDDDEEGEGDGGCAVWKLVGPVLVKVDADEARTNVRSRLKWSPTPHPTHHTAPVPAQRPHHSTRRRSIPSWR